MTRAVISGVVPTWNLADRLVKARTHAGLSQTELAEAIDLGRRSITGYENGVREPRRPVLLAWALATGVDQQWLMYGSDQPSDPEGAGAPSRTRTYDLRIKSP